MLPRNELEVNLAAARAWRMNENRKLSDLAAAGAAQIGKAEPVAEAGLLAAALEPWQAGTSYAKGTAFVHNGQEPHRRQRLHPRTISRWMGTSGIRAERLFLNTKKERKAL